MGARFLKLIHQNFGDVPRGSANLIDLNEDKFDIESTKFRGYLERERDFRR